MKYPPEVQERVDILNKYQDNPKLKLFDIIHMYPSKLAYPDGYYDARWFNLVGFNTKKMEKRDLGRHDAIFMDDGVSVRLSQVFADGAFLIKFREPVKIDDYQCVTCTLP